LCSSTSTISASPGATNCPYLTLRASFRTAIGLGEVRSPVQQPRGGLRHRLEHHHAGEHRERREVVGEIFLGKAHVLGRDDAGVGDLDDAVDEVELHDDATCSGAPRAIQGSRLLNGRVRRSR
jgi:hypothetical protein